MWWSNVLGVVRCYCNMAECITTGYMCKSDKLGCFSDLAAVTSPSSIEIVTHGCLDLLDKSLQTTCRNLPVKADSAEHIERGAPKSLLLCCSEDMCNDVAVSGSRSDFTNQAFNDSDRLVVDGKLAGKTRRANLSFDTELFFRLATVTVPVLGALILFMLVTLAIKLLRSDANEERMVAMKLRQNDAASLLLNKSHFHNSPDNLNDPAAHPKKMPLLYQYDRTYSPMTNYPGNRINLLYPVLQGHQIEKNKTNAKLNSVLAPFNTTLNSGASAEQPLLRLSSHGVGLHPQMNSLMHNNKLKLVQTICPNSLDQSNLKNNSTNVPLNASATTNNLNCSASAAPTLFESQLTTSSGDVNVDNTQVDETKCNSATTQLISTNLNQENNHGVLVNIDDVDNCCFSTSIGNKSPNSSSIIGGTSSSPIFAKQSGVPSPNLDTGSVYSPGIGDRCCSTGAVSSGSSSPIGVPSSPVFAKPSGYSLAIGATSPGTSCPIVATSPGTSCPIGVTTPGTSCPIGVTSPGTSYPIVATSPGTSCTLVATSPGTLCPIAATSPGMSCPIFVTSPGASCPIGATSPSTSCPIDVLSCTIGGTSPGSSYPIKVPSCATSSPADAPLPHCSSSPNAATTCLTSVNATTPSIGAPSHAPSPSKSAGLHTQCTNSSPDSTTHFQSIRDSVPASPSQSLDTMPVVLGPFACVSSRISADEHPIYSLHKSSHAELPVFSGSSYNGHNLTCCDSCPNKCQISKPCCGNGCNLCHDLNNERLNSFDCSLVNLDEFKANFEKDIMLPYNRNNIDG